jgi:FMN phosphatase YigB (HAD superfamily)
LFDVDGTLLLTHDEVYVEASRLALEAVFGIYAEGPDVPGDTAPAHIRRALRTVGVPDAEIDARLPRWCETFSAHYVRLLAAVDTSHWQLGPHAAEAVAAVGHRALLTGNPPPVAHARMERLGLAELFPRGQGAFGCEREKARRSLRSRA